MLVNKHGGVDEGSGKCARATLQLDLAAQLGEKGVDLVLAEREGAGEGDVRREEEGGGGRRRR
jgi:hypothetical protein